MPYAGEVVRYVHDTTSQTSAACSVLQAVPVGQTVIMAVNLPLNAAATTQTVTDSKGNTWTSRQQEAATPLNYQVWIWSCKVTVALTTSDTITVGVSTTTVKWNVLGQAFNDLSTYDQGAVASGSTATASAGPTGAGAQNAQLLFQASSYTDTGGTTSITPESSPIAFTGPSGGKATCSPTSSPRATGVEWAYVNASGTRTASQTLGASEGWGAALVVFNVSAPVASFSNVVNGWEVAVDGTGSTAPSGATITGYDWNWGDSTTHGTTSTASHDYTTAGTYTVTLTVTDSNGNTNATSSSITITAPGTNVLLKSVPLSTGWTPSTGTVLGVLTDGDGTTWVTSSNNPSALELDGIPQAIAIPPAGFPLTVAILADFNGGSSGSLTVKLVDNGTVVSTISGITLTQDNSNPMKYWVMASFPSSAWTGIPTGDWNSKLEVQVFGTAS